MTAKPDWSGQLTLAKLSCDVDLYEATARSRRLSVRRINKVTGNRLRQALIDIVTNEPVPDKDLGRCYEIKKGVLIPINEEDLETAALKSQTTIEIEKCVLQKQINVRWYFGHYFVVPNLRHLGIFAAIRDALRTSGLVGLGYVCIADRERPFFIEPLGVGLRGVTLRYSDEIRYEDNYFADIPDIAVPPEKYEIARQAIDDLSGVFDPTTFVDRRTDAVTKTLKRSKRSLTD